MARGFGSTLGSGTTDAIVTTLTAHATTRTYAAWLYRNGAGGSAGGRVFDKRTSGAQAEVWLYVGARNTQQYFRDFTVLDGAWEFGDPGTGAWNHVAWTFDSSSDTNSPIGYLNGVSQSLSVITDSSGSAVNNSDAYVIGNRTNDGARNWDGSIAEFGIWDAILTAQEVASLATGISPMLVRPASLVQYKPMVNSGAINLKGAVSTVTGTAAQPHPRVFYPARRQFRYGVAAAGGSAFAPYWYRQHVAGGMTGASS